MCESKDIRSDDFVQSRLGDGVARGSDGAVGLGVGVGNGEEAGGEEGEKSVGGDHID